MRAYRSVNGKKKLIAKSMTYHIDGEVHKSCVNAKALKIMKTKLALKKGSSKKITVKVIKQNSRKKLLSKKHVAPFYDYSTDKSIAVMSKKWCDQRQEERNLYHICRGGEKSEKRG